MVRASTLFTLLVVGAIVFVWRQLHYTKVSHNATIKTKIEKQVYARKLQPGEIRPRSRKRLLGNTTGKVKVTKPPVAVATQTYNVEETPILYFKTPSKYPFKFPKNFLENTKVDRSNGKISRYVSIVENAGVYYVIVNMYNQGNMITESKSLNSFPNAFRVFNKLRDFDSKGCMAATMMLYAENGTVYYIGGSAPALKPPVWQCEGHLGGVLNVSNLRPGGEKLKMVLRGNSLDTLPSITKYKGVYYKYTRWNIKKEHIRQTKVYRSRTLFEDKAIQGKLLLLPYDVYMANIFVDEKTGIFHGFFWCYERGKNFKSFLYENCFTVYATSVDGIDFRSNPQILFQERYVIPVNGHIHKNGKTFVFFLDYTNDQSFVFRIALSTLQEKKREKVRIALSTLQEKKREKVKKKLLFIIPFRDRHKHFNSFKQHVRRLSSKFAIDVYVVEQANKDHFNRGWLLNVGLKEAKSRNVAYDCVITSDVDIFGDVDYSWCDRPTHICSEMSCHGNSVPYVTNAGGVLTAKLSDWEKINGYTNKGIGWGGEDDDLFHRFRQANLLTGKALRRPAKGKGKCDCLHDKDHTERVRHKGSYSKILMQIRRMSGSSKEWKVDGLNNVKYSVDRVKQVNNESFSVTWFEVDKEKKRTSSSPVQTSRRPASCQGYKIDKSKLKASNGKNNFKNWKELHYKTCAVVASGTSLLNSGCGKEIDKKDAIFRINTAPSWGFEKDVGFKTTIKVSYGSKCVPIGSGYLIHGICVASHEGETSVKEIFKLEKRNQLLHERLYPKAFLAPYQKTTNIHSVSDAHLFYHKSSVALKYYNFNVVNPTSGFNALLASFDLCDDISLYGFDYGKSLSEKKKIKKVHYYDYLESIYNHDKNPHNFVQEWNAVKKILL